MYRVIIADDDVPFLESLKEFEWNKYDCSCIYCATNGKEALEKCIEQVPHIVIADINMPIMDGMELLRELNARMPEICVILLTVHKSFEFAKDAIKLNAFDYLVKDMNYRDSLNAVLQKAISMFTSSSDTAQRVHMLLRHGGKILTIESDDTIESPLVQQFISSHAGNLLTPINKQNREELIKKADSYLFLKYPDAGLIFHSNTVHFILPTTITYSMAFLQEFQNGLGLNSDTRFVYSEHVNDASTYIQFHNDHIQYAKQAYYEELTKLKKSTKQIEFRTFPLNEQDDISRQIRTLRDSPEELKQYITGQLAVLLQCKRYEPENVINLLDRCLVGIESRYCNESDKNLHTKLTAMDLKDSIALLAGVIQKIQQNGTVYSNICERAIKYMRLHFSTSELSLSEVADYVYISPGYLSKQLKQETGYSFHDLLTKIRMEKAAEMLQIGEKKVYEVAELCGYQNYRSFSTIYKQTFGVSPKRK